MSPGIHQGDEAVRTVEESPVEDEMMVLQHTQWGLWRSLLKVVINHAIKFPRAVPALGRQLPDRVAFNNPAPEPFPLPGALGSVIAPAKRAPTRAAEPTLSTVSIMTISHKNG